MDKLCKSLLDFYTEFTHTKKLFLNLPTIAPPSCDGFCTASLRFLGASFRYACSCG
ncbi:hypothetical protein D11S_2276 (plasmid) [Aggregatibacter actinomycetemcomitans D11S-1]|nr:hypothetical protein D11S_2276 [Aggregatibacter actinomycetemcomitans D11S-1]